MIQNENINEHAVHAHAATWWPRRETQTRFVLLPGTESNFPASRMPDALPCSSHCHEQFVPHFQSMHGAFNFRRRHTMKVGNYELRSVLSQDAN